MLSSSKRCTQHLHGWRHSQMMLLCQRVVGPAQRKSRLAARWMTNKHRLNFMPHLCKHENVNFMVVVDITDRRTFVSHRPDIQTAELHTTMWGSMITDNWDVDWRGFTDSRRHWPDIDVVVYHQAVWWPGYFCACVFRHWWPMTST